MPINKEENFFVSELEWAFSVLLGVYLVKASSRRAGRQWDQRIKFV